MTLLDLIKSKLGTDASPDDIAPDELGCAETVSTILNEYLKTKGLSLPIVTSTRELWQVFRTHHAIFQRLPEPVTGIKGGCIIISPTQGDNIGHAGFFLDDKLIASNSSFSEPRGLLLQNYTRDGWRNTFHIKKGLMTYVYEVIV